MPRFILIALATLALGASAADGAVRHHARPGTPRPAGQTAAAAASAAAVRHTGRTGEARLAGRAAVAAAAADGAVIKRSAATGTVRFVGTPPGQALPRPAGVAPGAAPETVARAFAESLGVAGALRATDTADAPRGTAVRLTQSMSGVPVLGGELMVNVDPRGRIVSLLGETEPAGRIDITPAIAAADARAKARAVVAADAGRPPAALQTAEPELAIFDPRLLGGPGLRRPALVWTVEVTGAALRRLVLVDAHVGPVLATIDEIETVRDRRICNAGNTTTQYPCRAPFDRQEGDPPSGNLDIDRAYDYAGDTYDYYWDRFNRDSLDGEGFPLHSTVNWCDAGASCPYPNAFWDGTQMVYGEGFAAADDVVGHELTHGLTDFTAHLFYYYQSGAINESLSDVAGEFIDLTNGSGSDTPEDRWLLGEDLFLIRNMKDPTALYDPDRMRSPYYSINPFDSGGVHFNSGVNNKAAYLMTDGATFNGQTIKGIGIDKVARLYFTVQTTMLTSASDFRDLRNGLLQACANLIGTDGFTAADCDEVDKATAATEMHRDPIIAPAPDSPGCADSQMRTVLFEDDLEKPTAGNWAHAALTGEDTWFYPQMPNPFDVDLTYATSGLVNFWGYAQPGVSDTAITMTHDTMLPSGATYLRFAHAFDMAGNSVTGRGLDGGVVEYSTDGGQTWQDAGPLGMENGYSGTLGTDVGNPLGGRKAFTGVSFGYRSTRVNLSSLAGQQVRIRFRIATDDSYDSLGWFIDDIALYACGSVPAAPIAGATTPAGPANDNAPLVHGTAPPGSAVRVYTNDRCTGEPAATGTAAAFADPGIAVSVPDDAETPITVQAADGPLTSPCSAAVRYREDSTAPPPPILTATTPLSGSDDARPRVIGTAEPGSTVRLFADGCRTQVATGPAATFADAGFAVTVVNDADTRFSATASDRAGNTSLCSAPLVYSEHSRCGGFAATIHGTPGDDVLTGTRRRDVIAGGTGNDTIRGLAGNDVLCGGEGDDTVMGGAGRDVLWGTRGRDTLRGGPGRDRLHRATR